MSRFSDGSIRRDIPGLPEYMIVLGNHHFIKKNKYIPNSYIPVTHVTPLKQDETNVIELAGPGVTKIIEFYRVSDGARYAIECRYTHDYKNKITRKYTNPHSALYNVFSGNFVASAIQHKLDKLRDFKNFSVELYTITSIRGEGDVLTEPHYIEIDRVSDPGVFEDVGAMGVVNVDKLISTLHNKGMIGKPNGKRKLELEEQAPVPEFYDNDLEYLIDRAVNSERIYSEEIKLALELQAKFKAFEDFKKVLYGNKNQGDISHIANIVSTYLQNIRNFDADLKRNLNPIIDEMQGILNRPPALKNHIDTLLKEIDSIFLPRFTQFLTDIQTLSIHYPNLQKYFTVDINDLTKPTDALKMLYARSRLAKDNTTEELARLRRQQLAELDADDDDFDGGSRLKQKKKTRKRTKKRNKSKRHKGYSRR